MDEVNVEDAVAEIGQQTASIAMDYRAVLCRIVIEAGATLQYALAQPSTHRTAVQTEA
jgi:homoaconitase/3-isopropylmalate dehydratase large subunit